MMLMQVFYYVVGVQFCDLFCDDDDDIDGVYDVDGDCDVDSDSDVDVDLDGDGDGDVDCDCDFYGDVVGVNDCGWVCNVTQCIDYFSYCQ